MARALADGPLAWRAAAADWTEVAPLGFRPVADPGLAADGTIALAPIPDADRWQALVGDASVVAFTLVQSQGGAIEDADVLLNTATYRFADAPTARAWHTGSVLAHELGHAVGLGHPCGDVGRPACEALAADDPQRAAVMYPRQEPGEVRGPGPDDAAGVQAHVGWMGALDRPADADVTPTPTGWSVPADLALARLWDGVALAGEVLQPVGPGPWRLELWSGAGQGHVTAPLPAPAAVRGEPGAEPAAGPAPGGDCRQAPGGTSAGWLFLFLTGLLPRRR
ncbi:MAG: hypothetical protein R3F43_29585 [bacterium]